MIDDFDVTGLRSGGDVDWFAGFGTGRGDEVDDVVIDHDGRHHDVGPAFAAAVGKQ